MKRGEVFVSNVRFANHIRYLSKKEEKEAFKFIKKASEIAFDSTCQRSRCGSVLTRENEIIGSGFNSPPKEDEKQRRCERSKDSYHKKVTDKTCCIHAEQRAIMDALKKIPEKYRDQGCILFDLARTDRQICRESPIARFAAKWHWTRGLKNLCYGARRDFVFMKLMSIILFLSNIRNRKWKRFYRLDKQNTFV